MKPKRYYAAMKVCKYMDLIDLTGEPFKIKLTAKEQGIVGMLPVFTNKKKAKAFWKDLAVLEEVE